MNFSSIGDLAQSFAQRHRNTIVKSEISKLTQEISSGLTSDIANHLGGSYSRLTSIESEIRLNEGYRVSIAEAAQFTDVLQASLGNIEEIVGQFSSDLLAANFSSSAAVNDTMADSGRIHFDAIVTSLNSQSAGRTLFSGDATDRAALESSEIILAEILSVVAGATSVSDIVTSLDDWFSDPAGFDTFAYLGSTTDLSPFQLSASTSATTNVRADDTALKDVLKSVAMAALVDDPSLGLTLVEQSDLIGYAATGLITSRDDVIALQARVGLTQETIDGWSARTSTERLGLDAAKGALLAIDPYESATKLEAASFQLESLYAITARTANLRLVNFL